MLLLAPAGTAFTLAYPAGYRANDRIRTHSDLPRHFGLAKCVVTEQNARPVALDLVVPAQSSNNRGQKILMPTTHHQTLMRSPCAR